MSRNRSSLTVFSSAMLRADLHLAASAPSKTIVVTFTERCHRDLAADGFGTEFLLRAQFDVLAIKNSFDDWYVSLSESFLSELSAITERYERRGCYGSSMGAYAALKFARRLGAQTSIAISPICDITLDWDTRFHVDVPEMTRLGFDPSVPMLGPADISDDIAYHIAFDPFCREDLRHAQDFAAMAERCTLTRVPFGGHPVGPALRDSGLLTDYVLRALSGEDMSGFAIGPVQSTPWVEHAKVRYLLDWPKLKSALVVSTRALAASPDWSEAQLVHAQILERLGRVDEALEHGRRAIELDQDSPYFPAIVAEFLLKNQYVAEAKEIIAEGIERIGEVDVLTTLKRKIDSAKPARKD